MSNLQNSVRMQLTSKIYIVPLTERAREILNDNADSVKHNQSKKYAEILRESFCNVHVAEFTADTVWGTESRGAAFREVYVRVRTMEVEDMKLMKGYTALEIEVISQPEGGVENYHMWVDSHARLVNRMRVITDSTMQNDFAVQMFLFEHQTASYEEGEYP